MTALPYIIADTSFILLGVLSKNSFCKDKFIENCETLRKYRHKGLRITNKVTLEVAEIMKDYISQDILEYFGMMQKAKDWTVVDLRQDCMKNFFRSKLRDIGNNESIKLGKEQLSPSNIEFCTYVLWKSIESDVIVATTDKLVIESLSFAYSIMHPSRQMLSWPDTNIYFAKSYGELERKADYALSVARLKDLQSYFNSNYHNWDIYGRICRKVWLM